MLTETKISVLFLLGAFAFGCGDSQQRQPDVEPKIKAATTVAQAADTLAIKDTTAAKPDTTEMNLTAEAALASINTAHYEFTLYKALAYVPKHDGVGQMKLKPGNRYLVLDVAVKNKSKSKELDMGQVLLSAKLRDKKGTVYPLNAMAVAAYTLDNPDPQHQAQYNALWGKLQPGETYRTFAVGFEVPESATNFVFSMDDDDNNLGESKRVEAGFKID